MITTTVNALKSINKLIDTYGYLVQATTRNKKTGDVPTVIIGRTKERTIQSCIDSGCDMLPEKMGGNGKYKEYNLKPCYAHSSTVSWATASIRRAIKKGTRSIEDYSLQNAFRLSSRTAKVFRLSSIGDASVLTRPQMEEIAKEGKKYNLKPMGYIAGWKNKGKEYFKQYVLASNFTMEQADEAVSQGWRSTVILPADTTTKTFVTPAGNKGIVCPEQTQQRLNPDITPRKKITCNICGLCSQGNQHKTKYKVIGFINH